MNSKRTDHGWATLFYCYCAILAVFGLLSHSRQGPAQWGLALIAVSSILLLYISHARLESQLSLEPTMTRISRQMVEIVPRFPAILFSAAVLPLLFFAFVMDSIYSLPAFLFLGLLFIAVALFLGKALQVLLLDRLSSGRLRTRARGPFSPAPGPPSDHTPG